MDIEPLTIPGTLTSLADLRQYVTAAATAAGLGKKAAYRLNLAVDEIATNVITHGYLEAGRDGVIDVNTEIDEEALIIHLEDAGEVYNPIQYQAPDDLDQPPEERQIGGLGVFIAIQSVDKFLYERIGNRNRHTFVMKRSKAS
jgi:anti-sigma regulatory factor (Ser/Thr protein kinase)